MPAPTLAEITRRLDEIATRFDRFIGQLEEQYVRKDVLDARDASTSIQMQGLEAEVHSVNRRIDRAEETQTANRRLVIASLIFPLIVGVIVALLLFALHR